MSYPSKVDWWFYLVAACFAAATVMLFALSSADTGGERALLIIIGLLFAAIFFAVILPVVTCTRYVLQSDSLFIQCGFLCKVAVLYTDIVSVGETRNPMSSAAPSLDRLEITTRYEAKPHVYKNGTILISPRRKQAFIDDLQRRNPAINFRQQV
jgi:hypothetical protein